MASLAPRSGVLGHRLAAHLLRRTTYHLNRAKIDDFATKTAAEAITTLFTVPLPVMPEPINFNTGEQWVNCGTMPPSCPAGSAPSGETTASVLSWWMHEAVSDISIYHKMTFFLHTCMTADNTMGSIANYVDHLALLRFYALGSYKQLAIKMSVNPTMLRYLNGNTNVAANPNENYAREFFELFTIGKGPQIGSDNYTNYTEADIVEAAKVFSGWGVGNRSNASYIDPDTNLPACNPKYNQHDQTDKTFSSAFGNTIVTGAVNAGDMYREISDLVEMVFVQDATALHICRKIYRFFVSRNITSEIEADIIAPLATTFRNNDYDLAIVMTELLQSQHFYDEDDSDSTDEIIGSMVKSPLELVFQSFNLLELPLPDPLIDPYTLYRQFYFVRVNFNVLQRAGMDLFRPPTVAGYPPYYQAPAYHRAWMDASTIVARYSLGERLTSGFLAGVTLNMVTFIENFVSESLAAHLVVTELLQYLCCEMPDADRIDYFLNTVFLNGLPEADWTYEWQNYLDTGDTTEVEISLNKLIKAILYSPEYQLF